GPISGGGELIFIVDRSRKAMRPIAWWRASAVFLGLVLQSGVSFGASCGQSAEDARVVVDVGHTATASGATSARGGREYQFNVQLAQQIRDQLVQSGFRRTYLMVTDVNGVAGLKLRAQRANLMQADLFLSVHHDAVRDEYLKPWTYQDNTNHYFDGAKGFSLHVANYGESLRLARMLADQLLGSGLDFTSIHRRDQLVGARVPFADPTRGIYFRDRLVVLYKTQMPSVLLEAGLIVNRE